MSTEEFAAYDRDMKVWYAECKQLGIEPENSERYPLFCDRAKYLLRDIAKDAIDPGDISWKVEWRFVEGTNIKIPQLVGPPIIRTKAASDVEGK